jgi:micrococcal nuclease
LATVIFVVMSVTLATTSAFAETITGEQIIVIDGDTSLPCAAPARGCAEKIRLEAIDAPETLHASCENELRIGLEAKERVRALHRGGPAKNFRSGRLDRYGRTLGDLTTRAGDVGAVLLQERLALPYRPGGRAKEERQRHWCGG